MTRQRGVQVPRGLEWVAGVANQPGSFLGVVREHTGLACAIFGLWPCGRGVPSPLIFPGFSYSGSLGHFVDLSAHDLAPAWALLRGHGALSSDSMYEIKFIHTRDLKRGHLRARRVRSGRGGPTAGASVPSPGRPHGGQRLRAKGQVQWPRLGQGSRSTPAVPPGSAASVSHLL